MSKPLCILVLGVPRSGTSCVAGILHHLGVSMTAPDCIGGATDANPKGFFSDTEFEFFCNKKYGTYFPVTAEPLTEDEREYLSDMIRARKAPLWGVKEWRISLFLDEFIELAGDVKVIRTSRPLERSYKSWNEHFRNLDSPSLDDYFRATVLIDNSLKDKVVTDIDFDSIVDDKNTVLNTLADLTGRPRNSKVDSMIDASLRRF